MAMRMIRYQTVGRGNKEEPIWKTSRAIEEIMKRLGIYAAILAVTMLVPAEAKKPKLPKPPSQSPIVQGCVTVFDIYSHKLGVFSGIVSPEPGVEAKIRNDCAVPVSVFVYIGYFADSRVQFGSGIESAVVGAGAVYVLYHQAQIYGLDRGALKAAVITKVDAFPQ
jgi:hypothetical protein